MLHIISYTDTASPNFYTLSLHDALPICTSLPPPPHEATSASNKTKAGKNFKGCSTPSGRCINRRLRSEEHTSELQSHVNLVCRLLLEKKKYEVCMHVDYIAWIYDSHVSV